jgi:hypothetical protein
MATSEDIKMAVDSAGHEGRVQSLRHVVAPGYGAPE